MNKLYDISINCVYTCGDLDGYADGQVIFGGRGYEFLYRVKDDPANGPGNTLVSIDHAYTQPVLMSLKEEIAASIQAAINEINLTKAAEFVMTLMRVSVGQFNNTSNTFVISDPCYDTDVWCRGELTNVRTGIWKAEVGTYVAGTWGLRVAQLTVIHESFDKDGEGDLTEHVAPFEVGVDSGQAGIFDAAHYRGGIDEEWYEKCCAATESDELLAGVIPFGVVSRSGFGDGGYDCIYYTDTDDMVCKITIVFICEEIIVE